jgi:hypothetical protein
LATARRTRVGLGVVDQTLSSASNMLALFAIASVSSVREFGAISFAVAGVMATVSVCRGLLGTPIALLTGDPDRLRAETDHALALAGALGVVVALLIASLSPLSADPSDVVLVAVAAPMILMQDATRFACIASGRPGLAVVSDGLWALGSATLFVIAAWVVPDVAPGLVIGGWTALAVVAALVILALAGYRPVPRGLARWLRGTAPDRLRYGATAAISAANGILFLFVVAALIGASAIAALRGSASVMGPLSILLTSMTLVAVPEFRRMPGGTAADYWRPMRRVALVMCAIPVAVGLASFVVPDSWGETLLGPTWYVAQPLLPITAIEYVALAWSYSADSILTARADSRGVLSLQVVHAVLITGGATVAALAVGTARGVAVGLAVGALVAAAYGVWRTFRNSAPGAADTDTLG